MVKGPKSQSKIPPPDPVQDSEELVAGVGSGDSSEPEEASIADEALQEGENDSTPGSPMQVEFDPEDSVTCRWEDCSVVFTDLQKLIDHIHNQHIGVHKSSYTCEWTSCNRRGLPQTSRFALTSHLRSHTGEKPYVCTLPECDKSFTRSDALKKHMRQQHDLSPPPPTRGGSRKQKHGGEDGFTTFKVDPATGESIPDTPIGEDSVKQESAPQTTPSTKSKGAANGRSRRSNKQPQAQRPPPPGIPHSPEAAPDGDEEDGYMSSASDTLPPSVMQHYDDNTGLVMGKTKSKAMYLLMKARLRYLTEQHQELSDELKDARIELEREKVQKETALDELLHRMLGSEAKFLIPTQMPLPMYEVIPDEPESTYDQAAPPFQNGRHLHPSHS